MSGLEVTTLLESLHEVLGDIHGVVKLNRDRSVLNSSTNNEEGRLLFTIGMRDMYENPDEPYPVGAAMIPIVAYFHEIYGHGGQIKTEFEKDTSLARVLALNYYACRGSRRYYGFMDAGEMTDQYLRQPHEIAAQYVALNCAYTCLSSIYGDKETKQMLLAYVRYRQQNQSEFIGVGQDKLFIDEIPWKKEDVERQFDGLLDEFDRTFKDRVFEKKMYSPKAPPSDHYESVWAYGKKIGTNQPIIKVRICGDGVLQDLMMSSAHAAMDQDELSSMKAHRALAEVDLSPDYAFSRLDRPPLSEPWKKDLSLEGLTDQSEHVKLTKQQTDDIAARVWKVRMAQRYLGTEPDASLDQKAKDAGNTGPDGPP